MQIDARISLSYMSKDLKEVFGLAFETSFVGWDLGTERRPWELNLCLGKGLAFGMHQTPWDLTLRGKETDLNYALGGLAPEKKP